MTEKIQRTLAKNKAANKSIFFFILFFLLSNFMPQSFAQDKMGVKTVVIDAGHGGNDPGCHGAKSNEKDVVLDIALKLGKKIEKNYKDVKVIYTRKTDVFIELHERARIANENNADLFICIHANAGHAKAHGAETYVMGLHKSSDNLKVAERENSSILMEENYKGNYQDFDGSPEAIIAMSLKQSAYQKQSTEFASYVQDQFDNIGRENRGVKQAGFVVLYRTAMPSVLIETGFLTNKMEEKFLTNPQSQDKMASSIFKAFKSYKINIETLNDALKDTYASNSKDLALSTAKNNKGNDGKKNSVKTTEVENNIIFKVQIATSSKKIDLNSPNFKGLENIKEYESNGLFKYVLGNARRFEDAKTLQGELRAGGFPDSFVIAFENDQRINLRDAIKKSDKK